MKTVFQVLSEMDEKFSTPNKWTKGKYGATKHGKSTLSVATDAVCWCLSGAICACTYNELNGVGGRVYRFLTEMVSQSLENWNDANERTFQDVKDLLQLAKEKAKQNVE